MALTSRHTPRPGTILPFLAIAIVALFGFVALAIDLGILAVSRTECQNAADAAALSGCRVLNNRDGVVENDRSAAEATARSVVEENILLNTKFQAAHVQNIRVGLYDYDSVTTRFTSSFPGSRPTGRSWSAMEVVIAAEQPTYFAKVFGMTSMPTGARARAVHRPRDVAIVLDFTGSMSYGSTLNWPFTGTTEGLMSPDPAYPKFGHYARYTYYQNNTVSASMAASGSVSDRPNPFQMRGFNGDFAPNNVTMETGGGPPIIEDFLTASGNPSVVDASTPMKNAFRMWDPSLVSRANTASLTPAIYSYSGYNAAVVACPAPDNFDTQSDSPVPYVGDKWPRTDGRLGPRDAPWSTLAANVFADAGVKTLKEFLGSALTGPAGRDLSKVNLPTGVPATTILAADGGDSDSNYRDAIWERFGYDLDVKDLRDQFATMPESSTKTVRLRPSADRFKGYAMGPGYWGKTFFVWPPDPRWGNPEGGAPLGGQVRPDRPDPSDPTKDTNGNWICDWRRRFFLKSDGSAFNPELDNINQVLFRSTPGHVLNDIVVSGGVPTYRLNYAAIMAWLKRGPQTLPANLRAGRILYYSSMPDDLTLSAAGNADDKMFWRHYIHYVLGVGRFDPTNAPLQTWAYPPHQMLAGVESRYPFGDPSNPMMATSSFDPNGPDIDPPTNPKPYLGISDNVNRPRAHFWFGPLTMLNFLKRKGEDRPWWAGTVREAQCWQLKAAVSSVLEDIRVNHPNDYCGMAFFATREHFGKPMAPMGQDWFSLKNSLFFRNDTVAAVKANPNSTIEHRPYTSVFANDTERIPNGYGGTDPNSGLAIAFNLLSNSSSLPSEQYGTVRGRRGAAKIVIFETDGIPNATTPYSLTGSGMDTRYIAGGATESWSGDASLNFHAKTAIAVVQRIVAPIATSGTSGFSTPNTPARVYSIAFGDLFQGYPNTALMSTTGKDALRFLLRVQQVGNTSGASDTGLPPEHVITGPYQRPNPDVPEHPTANPPGRIEKLRSALERIMQSGVQVTLIE